MNAQSPALTRPLKRLFSLPDASAYLGRSVAAVRALIKTGVIREVRIDRKVQLDVYDLDRLIEDSKRTVIN